MQVVKEPLGTKGARITCHLSLPGRFLVYMPTVDHIGVSRKIDSRDERKRLRTIVQRFREQSGLPGGVIIRTAAAHRSEEDITADLTYFQQVWTEIQRRRENDRTPAVLFREESLVTKLLRDLLTEQFTAIRIDDETEHRRVMSADQPHHAEHGGAGEALHEGLPDLRRIRRAGRDRQGAAQQGLAEERRLHRHQPDGSAGRDRREHGPLRRQEDRRAGSRTRSSRRTSKP